MRGRRPRWPSAGCRSVAADGSGRIPGAGRGSATNAGVGPRLTMAAGCPIVRAGTGFPCAARTSRVRYAPAVVEFVRVRDHIGWFPLHPRDRFIPWWERRDRRPVTQNITYVNRTYVTVVNQNNFISARPFNNYLVRDTTIVREVGSARMTESLPIPNRSSLRFVSETGVRHGQRPSATVLARPAVVRTAPPPPPLTFQQKFSEIEKNQGRPIAPAVAAALRSQTDHSGSSGIRFRPAAMVEDERQGLRAAYIREPSPAPLRKQLTPARGQKLATRENPIELKTKTPERPEHVQKPPAQPQQPASSAPASSTGAVKRLELPSPNALDSGRKTKSRVAISQALEQQQKLQRRQQEQQKNQEHQAQIHQQQQEQQRLQQLRQQQQVEQQARELQRQQEQLRAQQLTTKTTPGTPSAGIAEAGTGATASAEGRGTQGAGSTATARLTPPSATETTTTGRTARPRDSRSTGTAIQPAAVIVPGKFN